MDMDKDKWTVLQDVVLRINNGHGLFFKIQDMGLFYFYWRE